MSFSQIDPETQAQIIQHLITVYGLADNKIELIDRLKDVKVFDTKIPYSISDITYKNIYKKLPRFNPINIYIEGVKNGFMKFWYDKHKNKFVFSIGVIHSESTEKIDPKIEPKVIHSESMEKIDPKIESKIESKIIHRGPKSKIIHVITSDNLLIRQINNNSWREFITIIYYYLHIIQTTSYYVITGKTNLGQITEYKFICKIINAMTELFHDKKINTLKFSDNFYLPYLNNDNKEIMISGIFESFYLKYNYQNSDFGVQNIYYNFSK
jgi:hypothetical protein